MKESPKRVARFLQEVEEFYYWLQNGGRPCPIPYKDLLDLTYPVKVSADQVNLKYTYGCVYTGNNLYRCRYFFLPGDTSTYVKNGRDSYILNLKNVSIIKIERNKPSKKKGQAEYSLRRLACIPQVKSIAELTEFFIRLSARYSSDFTDTAKDSGLSKNQDITLNKKLLFEFLSQYTEVLCRYGVISSDPSTYIGWLDLGEKIGYIPPDVSCDPIRKEDVIDSYLPTAIDAETSLWFAASIFSLLKPLYEICKVTCNTRFALQILTEPRQDPKDYKNALKLLELQARMWCNFRDWPENWNSQSQSKFRKTYGKDFSLEFNKNFGFPIVIFGYRLPDGEEVEVDGVNTKDDKYFEEADEYSSDISLSKGNGTASKEFLEYICSANCLPVLIPGIAPKRNYPKSMCLTIRLDVHQPERRLRRYDPAECRTQQDRMEMCNLHNRINQYYMSCLQELQDASKADVKKGLQRSLKKAQDLLGTLPGNNHDQTEQVGCILSALYYVRDTLETKGQETKHLRVLISSFERKYTGTVTIADFADFIAEEMIRPLTKNSVIFYQDTDRIYLRYKKYWPAFQRYCAHSGIVLAISNAAFRRNVLVPANMIQPQYQVSSGSQYPRYDYRKKVGDIEETVLNLSKEILEYCKK